MSPLFAAGVELMLIGMGTVFIFLTILVFATISMSRISQRFAPLSLATQPTAASTGPTQEEVAAIATALAHARSRTKQAKP